MLESTVMGRLDRSTCALVVLVAVACGGRTLDGEATGAGGSGRGESGGTGSGGTSGGSSETLGSAGLADASGGSCGVSTDGGGNGGDQSKTVEAICAAFESAGCRPSPDCQSRLSEVANYYGKWGCSDEYLEFFSCVGRTPPVCKVAPTCEDELERFNDCFAIAQKDSGADS